MLLDIPMEYHTHTDITNNCFRSSCYLNDNWQSQHNKDDNSF